MFTNHQFASALRSFILKEQEPRLLLRDYEFLSEYNTYLIEGLPPGPVSSPGAASLEAALKSQLFEYEDSMGPLDVLFWYELLRRIGDIADYAEAVGDRLRLIIAR